MTRRPDKTLVIEQSSAVSVRNGGIDGSNEFLRDEDQLTPEEAARPAPVNWPAAERPDDWGSPVLRAKRKRAAA
jgi:hypothetical protein